VGLQDVIVVVEVLHRARDHDRDDAVLISDCGPAVDVAGGLVPVAARADHFFAARDLPIAGQVERVHLATMAVARHDDAGGEPQQQALPPARPEPEGLEPLALTERDPLHHGRVDDRFLTSVGRRHYSRSILRSPACGVHPSTTSFVAASSSPVITTSVMSATNISPSGV